MKVHNSSVFSACAKVGKRHRMAVRIIFIRFMWSALLLSALA
jgi:hypothetical protein